jgi:hypothetical protein
MSRHFFVFILFVLVTFVFTYPLIYNLTTSIPAFSSTDEPFGVLWDFWRISYSWNNNFNLIYTDLIAYPFGVSYATKPFRSFLWDTMTLFFGITMKQAVAYNVQVLFNFILSGFFIYLLVFYLTKDRFAGVFSGLIFSFCPQHFVRSWQHIGLAYFQWMPLYLLSLIKLKERINLRNTLLLGFALLILVSFDVHYLYFMIIATLVFLFYLFIYSIGKKENFINSLLFLKRIVLISLFILILISPQYVGYIKHIFSQPHAGPGAYNPFYRPFDDLFIQSARPLSYILPSPEHPIFGRVTKPFVGSSLWGVSRIEHQLYLGLTALIFAFAACRVWLKKRRKTKSTNNLIIDIRDDFNIGYFVCLVIVAWLFSQPPWWQIGRLKIFMPSYFMYKVLPMVRAYCRFGVVVILAVSVLAGFGLRFMLGRLKSVRFKVLLSCLVCILILFEFLNFPPFKVIDLTKYPKVYDWLKELPEDCVIAEYPLDVKGPSTGPKELYKFYQTIHNKKMINGAPEGSMPYRLLERLIELSKYDTVQTLKWLGVRYVLVHKKLYDQTGLANVVEDFDRIKNNRSLKFVDNFDDIYVYKVVAKPKEADLGE